LDRCARSVFLKGVKCSRVINFSGTAMPSEISARPVIDEIVAERAQRPVGQMIASLLP
jgi:hypothetical protein